MANITLRNVDEAVFKQFKVRAVDEGVSLGRAVTQALFAWAKLHGAKRRKSLLEFKPVSFGRGTEKLSEEVDKIVYGV